MRECKTDIAIFGAGPAGIAAAWQAGKDGKNVILVEATDRIGGVMGSCPGMMLGAGYPLGHSIGGFFEEFVNRMYTANPPIAERRACSLENFGDEVVYYSEYGLTILYDMLEEAGVTLLVSSIPEKVLVEENEIKGVECLNSHERFLVEAEMYLDCTGNGEIGYRAGVPYSKGNEEGLMMGASLTFMMENVDWDKAFEDTTDPYIEKYAAKGIEEGKIHKSIPQIYMLKGFKKGSVFFNTVTVTGVDGTDPKSVLKGTVIARKRALELARFMKEEVPGYENAFVSGIGPSIGIRETRRLEGMYSVTYEDVALATKFKDGIVACDNPLDEVFRDENTTHYSHEAALKEGYYTIPFRALVPRKVMNLMFAGRCMSVDVKAFASVRGMPQCMLMGQAIAVAAVEAIENKCTVQEVSGERINNKMKHLGVWGI